MTIPANGTRYCSFDLDLHFAFYFFNDFRDMVTRRVSEDEAGTHCRSRSDYGRSVATRNVSPAETRNVNAVSSSIVTESPTM